MVLVKKSEMIYCIFIWLSNCFDVDGRGTKVMTLVICDLVQVTGWKIASQERLHWAGSHHRERTARCWRCSQLSSDITTNNWSSRILTALIKWNWMQEMLWDKKRFSGNLNRLHFLSDLGDCPCMSAYRCSQRHLEQENKMIPFPHQLLVLFYFLNWKAISIHL